MEIIREDLIINTEDLIENPTPRVPVCLVLDTSYSMNGEPINELNEGVKLFFEAIKTDEIAKYSAEISVITFGDTVEVLTEFGSIEKQDIPYLYASGSTPMGKAVERALEQLEQRKNQYKEAGVDYYQPWLVLMTDGYPTDNISRAVQETVQLISERKLTIFPIGIGDSADMNILAKFSPRRTPLRLKGLNFCEFFEWLSKSVQKVSQSLPGEKIKLDIEGIKGWAEI